MASHFGTISIQRDWVVSDGVLARLYILPTAERIDPQIPTI